MTSSRPSARQWPWWGWLGLALVAVFWAVNWGLDGMRTHWGYDVPVVGFGRVFEMPILGYGGYLPFSLELYALYHLLAGVAGRGRAAYVLPRGIWETEGERR